MGLWTGASYVNPNEVYENKNPVFCKHCRHFHRTMSRDDCLHPNNIDHKCNTWYEPSERGKDRPAHLNKDNNCEWYKRHRLPARC